MPEPTLEWTVMVYLAADNNLTPHAITNLDHMNLLGSTDRVHIVAQVDLEGTFSVAKRHFVKVGGGLHTENVVPDPNSGSVADFLSFVRWVRANGHEAKNYLLVLWGHGSGVFDHEEDQNAVVQPPVSPAGNLAVTPGNGHSPNIDKGLAASPKLNESPLIPIDAGDATNEFAMTAVLPDDTSRDELTSRELKEAIEGAAIELGIDKIHIVGMDACLMSMVEIASQISHRANFMVASEHSIPTKSWPYGPILQKLTENPAMTAGGLCGVIVDEYIAFYKEEDSGPVTLSACDLTKTDRLVSAVRSLSDALRENLPKSRFRRAFIRARGNTQSFLISDYVDLFHLSKLLRDCLDPAIFQPTAEETAACQTIRAACTEVMETISNTQNPGESFVFDSRTETGSATENPLAGSHGVSIYFPLILPLYRELEFARATNWDSFLSDCMNIIFQSTASPITPPSNTTISAAAAGGPPGLNPMPGGTQQ